MRKSICCHGNACLDHKSCGGLRQAIKVVVSEPETRWRDCDRNYKSCSRFRTKNILVYVKFGRYFQNSWMLKKNGAEGRTYNLTYMEGRTSRFIVTDYRLVCRR